VVYQRLDAALNFTPSSDHGILISKKVWYARVRRVWLLGNIREAENRVKLLGCLVAHVMMAF
jgi:hypothetical protein